jgi:sortase A
MRDKRPVDELSIEELERILAIRKREERQGKLKRMERAGRVVASEVQPPPPSFLQPPTPVIPTTNAIPAPVSRDVEAALPITPTPQFDDEVRETVYKAPNAKNADRFWKSFINQSLLLVEVLAIVGLVFLGYQMFVSTTTLQQETANAQALADEQRRATIPTLAPTPQLQLDDFVLPGGHIITQTGEIRFNYDEVPANLIGLVQTQILQPNIVRPVQTAESALSITIPKINVDQTIVPGIDWEALKLGVGQLMNGVNPGDDDGNLVLAGHNDIYGQVFRYLDELEPGDEFTIRTQTQVFTYRITGTEYVEPSDVSVLQPRGGATVTLISCYPYQVNSQRIIVYAERVSNV